jgi:DNA-binding cell septation regulator SpoVG
MISIPFLLLNDCFVVQRVRLVGKPTDGMFCAFRHLRNVVVMPSKGELGSEYQAINHSLLRKAIGPWPHASVEEILMGQLIRSPSVDESI